jgi:hypothetical protein
LSEPNVNQTGDDTDTLRKVEACIKAGFRDGLPPHLQRNASSLEYTPGSDQSRIFVSSYSDFSRLSSVDIQGVLRQRLILVHGHPFDYDYSWDLPSMGRLHDVDMKVSVLGKSLSYFVNCFTVNCVQSPPSFIPTSPTFGIDREPYVNFTG